MHTIGAAGVASDVELIVAPQHSTSSASIGSHLSADTLVTAAFSPLRQ